MRRWALRGMGGVVAKGEKAVIVDSGFEATGERQAPAPLGAVENFAMTIGDQAGEADMDR